MASLALKGIYKRYPGGVVAVSDFTMNIKDKEFIILVGPSGCGKSTTLRMIAGLEEISEGELFIGDRLVNDVAPKDRDIAMVFQNYALYPHMSVFENMAFGLKLRKVPKDQIKKLVDEAAKILDIAHLLDRKPKALSGGQRQRVALGRAIVRDPQVFLLDEPLSNLDAKLRAQMRTELSKLHKKLGTTFIYVTHDQVEAMTMGDRIVVMKDGYIQQIDNPLNLYGNPVNKFVAGFIGSPQMNFIEAKLLMLNNKYTIEFGSEDTKTTRGRKFYIEIPPHKIDDESLRYYVDKDVTLGIRPENVHDEEMYLSNARTGVIEATVDVTEMMGAETYLYLSCEGYPMTVRVSSRSQARPQDVVTLAIDPNAIHLFDVDDEHSILLV
ncbi:MAG: sn-glycerol-3-phosphate ABC transporter ATP-binding protein UgpC [Oscillospiraceae bacterium]|nr:sn-glycerol-3-phosphate ABC transporter ATP-binding protein UgpC [Oscillospiraceae bacterium]